MTSKQKQRERGTNWNGSSSPRSGSGKSDSKTAGASAGTSGGGGNWRLASRLLKLTWRYRRGCLGLLVLQLASPAVGLVGLTAFGLALDAMRHAINPAVRVPHWPWNFAPPAAWPPLAVLGLISALMLLVAVGTAFLRFATIYQSALLTQQIVVQLRKDVYDKLQRLSFRFFDASSSGSIINRVTGDVQAARMFIDNVVIQVIVTVLTLVVYATYMLKTHLTLALACMAATPLMWLCSVLFSRAVRPWYRQARQLWDALVLVLSENVQGMHVVKCFGRQERESEKFRRASRRIRWQQRKIFRLTSLFVPTIEGISSMNTAVLLGFGGYLVITDPRFTLGQGLVVFMGLLGGFSSQVNQLANITNTIQHSLTAAHRVFEVLDTPVEIQSPPKPVPLDRAQGRVTFENVSFAYQPGDAVLQDVNFDIAPGQCVAILGATGSGKSTLLSLIPRFYDPVAGRVKIDGTDLKQLDVDDLRRNVGLVFQESFLFSNTVASNIAFGHPEATAKQIIEAAKIAAAHDFIQDLPHGYETVIGEHGCDLSGGQRQRLAIARAILLQPPILLLDDATSAVDPETEHEILTAMDNAMQGRTTFVVAHRLSTLRRADLILVLEQGRIVQRGTHEELMNLKGPYLRAARLQIADAESRRLLGVGEPA
ncbi:MAG: ABC transporter ATP-binding protein [Phycisphaeraceae bacterium]|nr:ABC transporter ATP-binding protein [Phycisphaeraceae bacterium]